MQGVRMGLAANIFHDDGSMSAHALGDFLGDAVDGRVHLDVDGELGVLEIETETGTGSMSMIEPFPGVMVTYNNFTMERCVSGFSTTSELLCVDWCREGRLEQPMPGGTYSYVVEGDLKIDDRSNHLGEFVLPTGRYCGVTVTYEVNRAQQAVDRALGGFPVSLRKLRERYCDGERPLLLHGCDDAARILSKLYLVPQKVRRSYCQIKALELLLFLHSFDPLPIERGSYYPRSQVERVKAARDLMLCDLSRTVTVEEAASFACMPLTTFKVCFKGVYGSSPAAYVRRVRMEHAAQLLRETSMRVSDVGGAVGYESPSKFSAAFKAAWGIPPAEYRRTK